VITLFKVVLFVIIVLRVRTQLRQVVVVGRIIPVVSVPLLGVNGTDRQGQTFMQLSEDQGGELLIPPYSLQLISAGAASGQAVCHANFLGLPVDLRIVFLEPGVIEDDVLLPKSGYSELDTLGVSFVVDHHIDYSGDAPAWFGLPSTMRTGIGCESRQTGRLQEMMYSESMKSPVTPQSTRAFTDIRVA
jgi:hypothetical protein